MRTRLKQQYRGGEKRKEKKRRGSNEKLGKYEDVRGELWYERTETIRNRSESRGLRLEVHGVSN